ncbi:MAG: tetratricopeptide repeat protein [Planctomycetota bacterium]|nr:tetratricopeptide repeat protein [Planctomycetota bacterium]
MTVVEKGSSPWAAARRKHGLALTLLVGVTAACFASTLDDGFINLDDSRFITRNLDLRSLSPSSLVGYFSRPHFGAYHPIHMLSYAIEFQIGGRWRPGLLHLDNVLLHAANVILAYLLFTCMLGSRNAAFLGALIFAVHPTHVESVAWLSQRKDLLSLFFVLISFQLHVLSRRPGARAALPALSFLAFVLALLSKASVLFLPLGMIAYDLCLARIDWRKSLLRVAPFVIAAGVAGLGMLIAQRNQSFPVGAFGGGDDVVRAVVSIGPAYARLFVLPVNLALFYPRPGVVMSTTALVAGNLALLGIVAFLARRPRAMFALIWTFASLLPTLALVPYGHYLADRYLYVPSVGISFLLVVPLARLSRSSSLYRPTVIGLVVIASLFAAGTVSRALQWDSPEVLWRAQIRKVPDSILARNNLAMFLERDGRWADALAIQMEVRRICEASGNQGHNYFVSAAWKAGALLRRMGGHGDARIFLVEARSLRPGWLSPLLELARLEAALGREDTPKTWLDEARRIAGEGWEAGPDAARIWIAEGEVRLALGKPGEAIPFLEKARSRNPTYPFLARILGEAYLLEGRHDLARRAFQDLIIENPANLATIDTMLRSWQGEGRPEATVLLEMRNRLAAGRFD